MTRYPRIAVIAGRPVGRHYHIERVPAIVTAVKVMTTIAQVAIVGGMLLGILYGIYALDIVVQP